MTDNTPGTAPAEGPSRSLPAWFDDAKLGIMISWGLYSVPGWAPLDRRALEGLGLDSESSDQGPFRHMDPMARTSYSEWYLNSMSAIGSPTWFYHHAVFGGAPYDDFRVAFEAAIERWDPESWIDVVAAAGAKYVVPLTKHHDGYLLYPSTVPSRWRPGYHTRRDVIGEVAQSARARGIRFGAYYSGGFDWSVTGGPELVVPRTDEYGRYADAHWREIVERYEPSILWNDIGYPEQGAPLRLFEDYYAAVPDGVVNDRFDVATADFVTPEYKDFDEIQTQKWEMCRGVGWSFGYNRQETEDHTLSGPDLVRLLVRVVARSGNLILGVGPDPKGQISSYQRESLSELGDWLAGNGEAIFGTRPWCRAIDQLPQGNVQWTTTPESLYAIIDGVGGETVLPLAADDYRVSGVSSLGSGKTIPAARDDRGLRVTLPEAQPTPTVLRIPRR